MDPQELDRRVHDAFDARRDPFADDELVVALEASDELERFVAMRAALLRLSEASSLRPRSSRRIAVLLAAAALLFIAVSLARFAERAPLGQDLAQRYAIVPAVLEYRLTNTLRGEGRHESTLVHSAGGRLRQIDREDANLAYSILLNRESLR